VFTDEEMILAARNQAARLQNLCIQQYRRLIYLLREKRSKYLVEVKREKEIYGMLISQRVHHDFPVAISSHFDHLEYGLTKLHKRCILYARRNLGGQTQQLDIFEVKCGT
jgi:hypothetical protein